jgi:penicillin amidase
MSLRFVLLAVLLLSAAGTHAAITVDESGIPHVRATSERELYFEQGWLHARERFFQMDHNRRLASGTLAELLGVAALPSDVQMRTIGLRRAAQRSLDATSPRTRAILEAYVDGVNAWLQLDNRPPEYGALGLSSIAPWTPVDSIVVGKLLAFLLSFDLDIARTVALQSYVQAGTIAGFNGVALFSQDLWRSAGFDPAATVPDADQAPAASAKTDHQRGMENAHTHRAEALDLMREYLKEARKVPVLQQVLDRAERGGSNLWAVSGRLTQHGVPMIANDPHLPLGTPSTFMPMGLRFDEPVFGSTVPGVPGVVHGYNSRIAWGSTNNLVDVTDTFSEQVVPNPASPSGLSTLYKGALEPLIPIPEVFRANMGGVLVPITPQMNPAVPAATLVMPRRDGGPIISLNMATGAALSVQYVGFGPTQEIEAFLMMNRARNVEDFKAALQRLDVGSQNFVYGDVEGNIAYFTSGEIPVREDLQQRMVSGVPPWFIRNGQGGNEWLAVAHPQPHQATPREVLPFAELPQVVNPRAGWFVNANNDPAGLTRDNDPLNSLRPDGGLFYMAYAWNRGFRAARINERMHQALQTNNRRISMKEMQAIQADVIMRDAEVLTPYIVRAFDRALKDASAAPELRALAADAGIAEAVARLRGWNGSTPTGLREGYDAGDTPGELDDPTPHEVRASIAASIYSAWRSRAIARIIDAPLAAMGLPSPVDEDSITALRVLLESFDSRAGKGVSGLDFFAVPGMTSAGDRRDFILLSSLRAGLDMLASPAFGGSVNQNDYRWGKYHRVVLRHPMGGPFNLPTTGAYAVDGGFQTVDASTHNARATAPAHFMFDWGPSHRTVVELNPHGVRAESIWPGGTSGVLGTQDYSQFVERWLANDAIELSLP